MSIPSKHTTIRHCYGQSPLVLEVTGENFGEVPLSDQFAAVAKFLREHDDYTVSAVNVEHDGHGYDYLVVVANPWPQGDRPPVYTTYGPKE